VIFPHRKNPLKNWVRSFLQFLRVFSPQEENPLKNWARFFKGFPLGEKIL
jgi:hypothetical protein